jgi:hypothetical protein
MLNRTVSQNRGLKRHSLQGIKDLVPLHCCSLSWDARHLLFRCLTDYNGKELEAKHIFDAGS